MLIGDSAWMTSKDKRCCFNWSSLDVSLIGSKFHLCLVLSVHRATEWVAGITRAANSWASPSIILTAFLPSVHYPPFTRNPTRGLNWQGCRCCIFSLLPSALSVHFIIHWHPYIKPFTGQRIPPPTSTILCDLGRWAGSFHGKEVCNSLPCRRCVDTNKTSHLGERNFTLIRNKF